MKLRNRLYIIVLTLFIAVINLVMYIVISVTSEESMKRENEVVKSQASFIADSLAKDMKKVMNSDFDFYWADENNVSTELRSTMIRYIYFYTTQNSIMEIWNGTVLDAFKTTISIRTQSAPVTEEGIVNTQIRYYNGDKYIYASTQLAAPFSGYKLVYLENINDLTDSINKQINILIIIDVTASVILAILLMLAINRLLHPLKKLSEATDRISHGKFDGEIRVSGNDEVSELARKFDKMRRTINKQILQLKGENQQRQVLIENMAHELRTPLTSISGYASYLKIAAASEDDRLQSINYIIEESARLEKLSHTMLTIADIRENNLIRSYFNIKTCIENVRNTLHEIICDKSIDFVVESEEIMFNGNEPLIESLILNLSENAMRACSDGGRVVVSASLEKEIIHIMVADNGVGMTEDELKRIEEPFYRVDKARSRKYGGVGLGTALCKQIVFSHGGTIKYTSEYGEGTNILVELPIFTT